MSDGSLSFQLKFIRNKVYTTRYKIEYLCFFFDCSDSFLYVDYNNRSEVPRYGFF